METAEKEKASSRCARWSGLCTAKETLRASWGVRFFLGEEALLRKLARLATEAASVLRAGVISGRAWGWFMLGLPFYVYVM